MSRRITVDPAEPDPVAIAEAAVLLRAGGLVAFPTETVYGLGAHALDPAAVRRIYKAKGRPAFNPLIVHVATAAEARELVLDWPARAQRLSTRFWPGPLTLVLPKVEAIPDEVTAGLPSVAVRVPSHPVALALLREARIPVAAPSANRSTEVSPTTADHVLRGLEGRVDLVLDGGATNVGIESTVVDLTGTTPRLLRPGMITLAQLEEVIGTVDAAARGAGRRDPAHVSGPGGTALRAARHPRAAHGSRIGQEDRGDCRGRAGRRHCRLASDDEYLGASAPVAE